MDKIERFGLRNAWIILAAVLAALSLGGCASMAEGVARAVLSPDERKEDMRKCYIRGPSFAGVEELVDRQSQKTAPAVEVKGVLKVLMVHGIGTHLPGYSTRLQENLARAMGLPIVSGQPKEIAIQQPLLFPGEKLGTVRVHRYTNDEKTREMVFYELTWSEITDPDKRLLAYDDSGEYVFRRAMVNNLMKSFVNSHIPDPLIYLGQARERIQVSVSQTFCWMLSRSWDEMPPRAEGLCDPAQANWNQAVADEYVFISHSLGSRVVTDALQRLAELVRQEIFLKHVRDRRVVESMRDNEFTVFMLANQLPLLQLGREAPKVTGRIAEHCTPGGSEWNERLFSRLNIVAFSDPNDILSWAVPPDYVDRNMDSRVCPSMVNVIINVAEVKNVFGIEFADPAMAHGGYDDDQRVINLIARGIGGQRTAPLVAKRCEWLETR